MLQYFLILKTIPILMFALTVSGCSDAGVTQTGQVFLDGQPLSITGKRSVRISFTPVDSDKESRPIVVSTDSDGTFRVADVPEGKYRVEVSDFENFPYKNGLANYFRENPDTITMVLPTEDASIHISSEWYTDSER